MPRLITAGAGRSGLLLRLLASEPAFRGRAEGRRRPVRIWGIESLEGRIVPATITVTSLGDAGPATLRAAITQANLDTAPDTITFAPSVRGTIALTSALPELMHALTIDGPGASVLTVARRDATETASFRIFTVPAGAEAMISGLTVMGGAGGVENDGILALTDAVITRNMVYDGGGGGIVNRGTLTMTGSSVSHNSVLGSGIGGNGGGILNSGTMTVIGSSVSSNNAANTSYYNVGPAGSQGGGIWNAGTLTVINSTLGGNGAAGGNSTQHGGGGGGAGGGIYNSSSGKVALINDSFVDNTAGDGSSIGGSTTSDGVGGGVYASAGGTTTSVNCVFQNAQGGNVVGSGFISLGHNLFSDKPDVALDPKDLINTDPVLGPLADNGGPTQTVALLPGSPAIDAGVPVDGVTTDQRGVSRPQGNAPDIGAFESRGFGLSVVSGDNQQAQAESAFPAPLVVQVSSAYGEPIAGGRVTFGTPVTGPSATFANGFATLDANGRAGIAATANGLRGSYIVTALATGANSANFRLTNSSVPPTVVGLRRFGIHRRPTHLVLSFSSPLDSSSAIDVYNYTLVRVGPRGRQPLHPRTIRIKSVFYDATAQAVTLIPKQRLNLHYYYRLAVRGTSPGGVAGADGTLLDGAGNGRPGSDYVSVVHEFGAAGAPQPGGLGPDRSPESLLNRNGST